MILVDIHIPSIDKRYDFSLDETAKAEAVIEEIIAMVSQSEQIALKGDQEEFLLCSSESYVIMPKEKSLEQCGITTGSELILI